MTMMTEDVWDKTMRDFDNMSDEEFLDFIEECDSHPEYQFVIRDNQLICFQQNEKATNS